MPVEGRPLKLTNSRALEAWFERTEVEEWKPVVDALLAIQDNSWSLKYEWFEELTKRGGVILQIEPDLWLVWYVINTYPNYFGIIYLGDPGDFTYY